MPWANRPSSTWTTTMPKVTRAQTMPPGDLGEERADHEEQRHDRDDHDAEDAVNDQTNQTIEGDGLVLDSGRVENPAVVDPFGQAEDAVRNGPGLHEDQSGDEEAEHSVDGLHFDGLPAGGLRVAQGNDDAV